MSFVVVVFFFFLLLLLFNLLVFCVFCYYFYTPGTSHCFSRLVWLRRRTEIELLIDPPQSVERIKKEIEAQKEKLSNLH